MIKTKVAFLFQIVLIGWIKAGPPKKPLLFWSCKLATSQHSVTTLVCHI